MWPASVRIEVSLLHGDPLPAEGLYIYSVTHLFGFSLTQASYSFGCRQHLRSNLIPSLGCHLCRKEHGVQGDSGRPTSLPFLLGEVTLGNLFPFVSL